MPAFFIVGPLGAPPHNPGVSSHQVAGKEQILALAEPVAAELGLEVLDIQLSGNDPRRVLRIFLDSPENAVSVADCEAMSRRMGDVLDAHSSVAGGYMLEVSSPGVNRPLVKATHFRRVVGDRVRLHLVAPVEGSRNLVGRLTGFDDEVLTLLGEGERTWRVALRDVERANLEYEFPRNDRPKNRRH